MADLLREQFPYFRPIVEAFGYRNLEFEGWEADDVIATLATRADEAGIKTCVVSTDRDAFQLVLGERLPDDDAARRRRTSHVYTPERVEARYGIRPDQVPDFIGLKGDTSDNIPGVPGIGDKTAGPAHRAVRLGRGGDRARRRALAGAQEEHPRARRPSRASRRSSRRCGATSTSTATRRELVLAPPDRSQLREMFRRFEFRNLLNRIDLLDEAVPAAERPKIVGTQVAVARGRSSSSRTGDGYAVVDDRARRRGRRRRRRSARRRSRVDDARDRRTTRSRCGVEPLEDTMLAAYLIEPGRAEYELDDLAAEYGVELDPRPRRRRGDAGARQGAPRRRAGSRR